MVKTSYLKGYDGKSVAYANTLSESLRQVRADSNAYGELPPISFLSETIPSRTERTSALRIMRLYENFS